MSAINKPGSYFVEVEDWDTQFKCRRDGQTNYNFVAKSGWVNPGPTRPITTDFTALTDAQKEVMRRENLHCLIKSRVGPDVDLDFMKAWLDGWVSDGL